MDEKKQQLIIVDDATVNARIHRLLLQKWNTFFDVVELENAANLLTVIKSCKYEKILIFLDLYMPEMDGYSFLSVWKENQHEVNKDISIVVVSSAEQEVRDLENLGLHSLVKGYLMKPVTFQDLERVLVDFMVE